MTPEHVFRTAKTTGNYTATRQKTGFQVQFNGRPVGGYALKSHWYVLNKFASEVHEDHEAILKWFGFELKTERTRPHRWWKLKVEAPAASSRFCHALAELTAEDCSTRSVKSDQQRSLRDTSRRSTSTATSAIRETVVEAIKRHGTQCFGCKLTMRERYGEIAEGFIHIHHTKPLATVRGSTTPDLEDLVPLCPNCHAVVHLHDPPLTIDQLRECIDAAAR